jgi:hypothetical protein
MRLRAKSIVRFDTGLAMQLHAKCRKSVAKFRTALFEVLTWLKVGALTCRCLSRVVACGAASCDASGSRLIGSFCSTDVLEPLMSLHPV